MSNEKKLEQLRADGASAETVQRLRKALEDAESVCRVAEVNAGAASQTAKQYEECRAKADELREKAEAEAFGARFHRLLLAAMKRGSTNVVDMLGAAMEAAGVESWLPKLSEQPHEFRREYQCHPPGYVPTMTDAQAGETLRDAGPPKVHAFRNLVTDAGKAEAFMTDNPREKWPVVVKAQTLAGARRALDNLGRAEKSEPAPPAYSVEERTWRKGVEVALAAALNTEPDDLEDLLREVARRSQPGPVVSAIRNAALEDVAGVAKKMAERNLQAMATAETDGMRTAYSSRAAAFSEMEAECRALKSKPAPQPSGNPGEFE